MTRNIDELSNLTTQKAEPPKEYFGKMDLNEEQVEKRLQYTKKANELFDVILILLLTMNERGETNFFYAKSLLESWILSLVAEFTTPDDYLMDYATDTAYNFVDTTNKHIDEPWYTSSDRALYNAENGANDVLNYTEYKEAIEAGKTEKRWITEKDNRVRKSHKAVTQKPIPILEYFRVGMAQMRFPKDYELAAAFPEELVNCRCTIEYLPKENNSLTNEDADSVKMGMIASSDNGFDWSGEYNKISKEDFAKLRDFAESKGLSLRGVKDSYLDPQLVQETIESTSNFIDKYKLNRFLPNNFELDFSRPLRDADFAETNPGIVNTIYFNKNAYRDKAKLANAYQSLVDNRSFVQGSDYRDIPLHEMGHIIDDILGIDNISVALEVSGRKNWNDLTDFLISDVSTYSASFADGSEIISEAFVAANHNNKFGIDFIKKCGII